eukprot:g43086.t1
MSDVGPALHSPSTRTVDVVVVGAGLAGLRAACLLVEARAEVIVVEARHRLGGRTLSYAPPHAQQTIDKGAGWVAPSHKRFLKLAQELGLHTFAQPTRGDGVFVCDHGERYILREYWWLGGLLPLLGPGAVLSALYALMRLDSMAKQLPAGTPWKCIYAREWEAVSLADLLDREVENRRACNLLKVSFEGILLHNCQDVSLLWWLFYVRSAGGTRALTDDAQAMRVTEGTQSLAVRLANNSSDTVQVSAACVVLAISPKLLQRIEFDRHIPRSLAGQAWFAGTGVKWTLFYRSAFWKTRSQNGFVIHSKGMPWVFDGSSCDGEMSALVGFLTEEKAKALCNSSARCTYVLDLLTEVLGENARSQLVSGKYYSEKHWNQEEWSDCCVNGIPPGSTFTEQGEVLFQGRDERLIWAGCEHALSWNGYMEGALSSGEAAAVEAALTLSNDLSYSSLSWYALTLSNDLSYSSPSWRGQCRVGSELANLVELQERQKLAARCTVHPLRRLIGRAARVLPPALSAGRPFIASLPWLGPLVYIWSAALGKTYHGDRLVTRTAENDYVPRWLSCYRIGAVMLGWCVLEIAGLVVTVV